MTAINGSAAAVTGAASGIGRALAIELAASGRKVTTHRLDVSEPAQIQQFAQAATEAHPALNILINNAGVALLGEFNEIDQAQFEWLMNINFWGVVHGSRAFMPHLQRQRAAHIVNISSIFGIIAPAGQTAYCASKFAVRGFSEALRHEFWLAKSPIQLTVVHPGGIKTNIARNMRTGAGVTDNARRAQCQDHAGRGGPDHHQGHREQRAARPDRRRRQIPGPAAALPPGQIFLAAAAADREAARRAAGDVIRLRQGFGLTRAANSAVVPDKRAQRALIRDP